MAKRLFILLMPLKINIYQLVSNVQLTGSKSFDLQILMHSCTPKDDVSLAEQSQKKMSKEHCKHGVIMSFNSSQSHIRYKIIQQLMNKLFMMVN